MSWKSKEKNLKDQAGSQLCKRAGDVKKNLLDVIMKSPATHE